MKEFLPFEDAREYVRNLHLKNVKEFRQWSKTNRPSFIPSAPNKFYQNDGWESWGDWLGTSSVRYGRKHTVNDDFFSEWNDDMAYVLGFWWADGNLAHRKGESYRFSICQKEDGKELLQKIAIAMESSYPIYEFTVKCYPSNKYYRIQLDSLRIAKDLMRLGGTTRKSYSSNTPNIPKKYYRHFLRGFFDGDGSIFESKDQLVIDIVFNSNVLAQSVFDMMREVLPDISMSLKKRTSGHFDIKMYGSNSVAFCNYLYNTRSGLRLDRKFNVFELYMEKRNG